LKPAKLSGLPPQAQSPERIAHRAKSWRGGILNRWQLVAVRVILRRGTRPRIKRDRRFTWAYLFGAICPARGTGAALVIDPMI